MSRFRLTAFFALALAVAPQAVTAQNKVKIGYVNTFSGPNAFIGNDQRDGFELALDHLGRKMGGLDVEVFYEDDQLKPEVGKQVTDKLIQVHKVDFLAGYNFSNILLASLKPAVDSKTFIISANAGPHQVAGELCSPWFFSTSWQNDQTPMALGETLNRKGIKRLFILAPNYAAGKDMVEGVKRTFKGEVAGQEFTRWPDQLDFSTELSKVRAAKPDAVFVFYPGQAGVQFVQQYAQAGLKEQIPLYSVFTVDTLSLPQLKDTALGLQSTQTWVPDLDVPTNKKFVADFRKKYGRYPSYYSAQNYDAAMLINSAVTAVNGDLSKKDQLREAMRKADFEWTRGRLRYNKNHIPISNLYLQEAVKDDEGGYTLRTVETILRDHKDVHADKCKMSW